MIEYSVFMSYGNSFASVFSVGIREAEINVAEGKKKAKILNSEAFQIEQVNIATGMNLVHHRNV